MARRSGRAVNGNRCAVVRERQRPGARLFPLTDRSDPILLPPEQDKKGKARNALLRTRPAPMSVGEGKPKARQGAEAPARSMEGEHIGAGSIATRRVLAGIRACRDGSRGSRRRFSIAPPERRETGSTASGEAFSTARMTLLAGFQRRCRLQHESSPSATGMQLQHCCR